MNIPSASPYAPCGSGADLPAASSGSRQRSKTRAASARLRRTEVIRRGGFMAGRKRREVGWKSKKAAKSCQNYRNRENVEIKNATAVLGSWFVVFAHRPPILATQARTSAFRDGSFGTRSGEEVYR